ncbi:phage major tail tube protein [Brevibacillus sp. H7]|uniref:phage major tail tube protein n=1 Tax=Brevibacillus sp. H7 TaxID=3349138 RepID=UPI00383014B3
MNKIPERLNDFRAYRDGTNDLLGVVEVTLPALQALTETVSGAGIAGEFESPTLGQFQSMKVGLNWRTVTSDQVKLSRQQAQRLDLRGANQIYDAATGKYSIKPIRVVVQGPPTNNELGKLAKNSTSDGSTEIEVLYLKIQIEDKTVVEIDKLNYICIIDGVDYLKETRKALGL